MPRRNGSKVAGVVEEPHIPSAEKRVEQLTGVRAKKASVGYLFKFL